MADRSDLWAPPVRKWMTEWHSPVLGMFDKGRTFRGGALPGFGPKHASLLLEGGAGFLLLESLAPTHLALEPLS